jgi:hypothetical protein
MTTYDEVAYAGRAYAIWEQMSEGERNGVRFGIFPIDRMTQSETKGSTSASCASH